jgi:hypothetical protein
MFNLNDIPETLKKIDFTDINQFVEDINRNFAVIENSPLYKGIGGDDGLPGLPGLRGSRGSGFSFAYFESFDAKFPGELSVSSDITLDFINLKVKNFLEREKLLEALSLSELVNGDVIVLPSSEMVSYDAGSNEFISTKISFNQKASLISSIEEQIEAYVKHYVDVNPTILSLKNVFDVYSTLAKTLSDTNSLSLTSNLVDTSVYVPYIKGYTANTGYELGDHKYYGYSENVFPKNNKGTVVFGNMKNYVDLIQATLDVTRERTYTSDYAPGVDNIPTAVFMQDTYGNGLMFGFKGRGNLKAFAQMYKDEEGSVIIKTDAGKIETEFSKLIINKNWLKFKKHVMFGDNLTVDKDFTLVGNINNAFIRTNEFTSNQELNTIEVGIQSTLGKTRLVSNIIDFPYFVSNVLITDNTGNLLKDYSLETTQIPTEDEVSLKIITVIPNSQYKVLTSNYLGFVIRKFNTLTQYSIDNYWRKNQFDTFEIPKLSLNETLRVKQNVEFGDTVKYFLGNTLSHTLDIGFTQQDSITNINSDIIKSRNYTSNVIVTDPQGSWLKNYSIFTDNLPLATDLDLIDTVTDSRDLVLTTYYLDWVVKNINIVKQFAFDNYWRKNQFDTGEIPNLKLSGNFYLTGLSSIFDTAYLYIDSTVANFRHPNIILGTSGSALQVKSNTMLFDEFRNVFLYSDSTGNIQKDIVLFNTDLTVSTDLNLLSTVTDSRKNVLTTYYLDWIVDNINVLKDYVRINYWRKDQFTTAEIPDLKISGTLMVSGDTTLGNATNPYFKSNINANYVQLGYENGTTVLFGNLVKMPGYKNLVLCTDADGNLTKLRTWSVLPDTTLVDMPVDTNAANNQIPIAAFSEFKLVSEKQLAWVVKFINLIKTRFKNTFNKDETIIKIKELVNFAVYQHVPVGTIVMWNPSTAIPVGWAICNGSNGTPNLTGKFIKAGTASATGGRKEFTIVAGNLPQHNHAGSTTSPAGAHTHSLYINSYHNHPSSTYSSSFKYPLASSWESINVDTSKHTFTVPCAGNSVSILSDSATGYSSADSTTTLYSASDHTHTLTITQFGAAAPTAIELAPEFYTLVYIMKLNVPPFVPPFVTNENDANI